MVALVTEFFTARFSVVCDHFRLSLSGKKSQNRPFGNLNLRPGGRFDVLKYFFEYSMRRVSH